MKTVTKCPACGSTRTHEYTVPNHPELKGKNIDIMSLQREGITICRLVTCENCGCVYDQTVAKKIDSKSSDTKTA